MTIETPPTGARARANAPSGMEKTGAPAPAAAGSAGPPNAPTAPTGPTGPSRRRPSMPLSS